MVQQGSIDGAAFACGLPRLSEAHRCRLDGYTFCIEEAREEFGGERMIEQLRRYAALADAALAGTGSPEGGGSGVAAAALGPAATPPLLATAMLEAEAPEAAARSLPSSASLEAAGVPPLAASRPADVDAGSPPLPRPPPDTYLGVTAPRMTRSLRHFGE